MKDPEELLKKGAAAWNAWRSARPQDQLEPVTLRIYTDSTGRDLQGIDLSHLVLHEASFRGADLRKAIFRKSVIEFADFAGADLTGARFEDTKIYLSDFSRANLQDARFGHCHFADVELSGADMGRATSAYTAWSNLDLSGVKGLDAMIHGGPSTVGIDTLYASGGHIPEAFLRGAGVPEGLITLQQSLVKGVQPIQFYSCFISYSHEDEEFAMRLRSRLQDAGLRVWFAPEDMKGGRKLLDQVEEAIRLHDKLLLVLSETSMASNWVKTEVSKAHKRASKEHRQVLFPIRLVDLAAINAWESFDASSGIDYAEEIRSHFIPDFSRWKDHDSFEVAFKRLLSDLRASA